MNKPSQVAMSSLQAGQSMFIPADLKQKAHSLRCYYGKRGRRFRIKKVSPGWYKVTRDL